MAPDFIYEIRVKGVLDAKWSICFIPLEFSTAEDETILTGPVNDQPELFGILWKIRDLGLQLISVKQVQSG